MPFQALLNQIRNGLWTWEFIIHAKPLILLMKTYFLSPSLCYKAQTKYSLKLSLLCVIHMDVVITTIENRKPIMYNRYHFLSHNMIMLQFLQCGIKTKLVLFWSSRVKICWYYLLVFAELFLLFVNRTPNQHCCGNFWLLICTE